VSLHTACDDRAAEAAASAPAASRAQVAEALSSYENEPWAFARIAELLVQPVQPVQPVQAGAGEPSLERLEEADRAHARALTLADDASARREIVARWMTDVAALPPTAQLELSIRAADRALAAGESDEAYRWAQSAAALTTDDARVTLLLGRASAAMGDLVAAKVALDRARAAAKDAQTDALVGVELAEVAYTRGDLAGATREAEQAIARATNDRTKLKARNTLGKILLAEARWEDADRHFAEDILTASAAREISSELRARLNRGIALLSKGLIDEARVIFESVLLAGERSGEMRACVYALSNLGVVAMQRHEYATALGHWERTIKLLQHMRDRITAGQVLANLAELRLQLGRIDHAEHTVTFGRRALGPGMPAGRASHFAVVAARIALTRGHTLDARREITAAIAEAESAGDRAFLGEAHRVACRIALEDGNLVRALECLERARDLATKDDAKAEVALLTALHERAMGGEDLTHATRALFLARQASNEAFVRESHILLAELHRSAGSIDAARTHVEQAMALRDKMADSLPGEVRLAYLAQPDIVALSRLQALLVERSQPSLDEAPTTSRGTSLRASPAIPREMVGDDPAIRGLLSAVRKVARSNSTVLVRGESGTGKELIAEALHRASDRAAGPLVTVNCAALVETLLLSELFGHEKGAFTGAFARRRGRFELAEGGTLFLDEIGDISPRTQVALLRVLQERTFERVGGTTAIRANVRIVCATHRDLRAMVERGEFREDLYYRLRGITLEVPALRARMGDLPRISANLLMRIAAERSEPLKTLSPDAIDLLSRHRWPGNVRELENALRAASLFAESETITASDLTENVDDLRTVAQTASVPRSSTLLPIPVPSFAELPSDVSVATLPIGNDSDDGLDSDAPLPSAEANATAVAYAQVRQGAVSLSDMKRQIERDCIARALSETKGNITRAAALLGMKRPRLSQLVKQYGLAAVSSEAS
jgi:transcriptional regulator with GAF, ATPase, and Fis domain